MSSNLIRCRSVEVLAREDGIILVTTLPGVKQSLEDARENLAAAIKQTGGVRRPILIDISRAEPLRPEVRHYYSGKKMSEAFTALAIQVTATPFSRMMGNIYLRIANPGVPIRLFEDQEGALRWLKAVPDGD